MKNSIVGVGAALMMFVAIGFSAAAYRTTSPRGNYIHSRGTYGISGNTIINTNSGRVVATRVKGGKWVYSDIVGTSQEFAPLRPNEVKALNESVAP